MLALPEKEAYNFVFGNAGFRHAPKSAGGLIMQEKLQKIREEAQKVYDALQILDIETGRGKRKKG